MITGYVCGDHGVTESTEKDHIQNQISMSSICFDFAIATDELNSPQKAIIFSRKGAKLAKKSQMMGFKPCLKISFASFVPLREICFFSFWFRLVRVRNLNLICDLMLEIQCLFLSSVPPCLRGRY